MHISSWAFAAVLDSTHTADRGGFCLPPDTLTCSAAVSSCSHCRVRCITNIDRQRGGWRGGDRAFPCWQMCGGWRGDRGCVGSVHGLYAVGVKGLYMHAQRRQTCWRQLLPVRSAMHALFSSTMCGLYSKRMLTWLCKLPCLHAHLLVAFLALKKCHVAAVDGVQTLRCNFQSCFWQSRLQ